MVRIIFPLGASLIVDVHEAVSLKPRPPNAKFLCTHLQKSLIQAKEGTDRQLYIYDVYIILHNSLLLALGYYLCHH